MITSPVEIGLSVTKNGIALSDFSKTFKAVSSEDRITSIEIASGDSYTVDLTDMDNIALLVILAAFNETISTGSNQTVEGKSAPIKIEFNSNFRNAFGFEAIGLDKSVSTANVILTNNHPEAKVKVTLAAFCEA
jgi:hypothetical protein